MQSLPIYIEINDQEVTAGLSALHERMTDLSPAMQKIAGVLQDDAEQAFADEVAPDGTPWEHLKQSTIKQRIHLGYWPGKMLQRTGRLATSITPSHGADFAEAGTNVVYAATMQFGARKGAFGTTKHGAPIPWGDIPPRPFLGFSDSARSEVLDILAHFLF